MIGPTIIAVIIIILYMLFAVACVPYKPPMTVYTPVTIIEPQKAIIEPSVIVKEEEPTLYIKDAKAEVLTGGVLVTFKTTAEAIGKVSLIVGEKEFYSLYDITPTKEHRFSFGGLKTGLNYTAVINSGTASQLDRTVISFVSASSYTDSVSQQSNSWSPSGYTAPQPYESGVWFR
jgi:hypothetical protein